MLRGSIIAGAEGTSLVGWSGGAPKRYFLHLSWISLRKVDIEYENGKQLQVTIIKVTESKENKSIHRLDVSGSIGSGGQLPLFPPPPSDSYGSDTFASLGKYKSRSELLAFTLETRSLQACIYRICLRQERRHSLSLEGSKRVYVFNRENILTQGPDVSWKEGKSGRIILL